jgi:hypothetical protein
VIEAIRNHPEARWLPSRHRLAAFRLYALLRLVTTKPRTTETEFVLPIDRDQSAHEQFAVAAWVYLTALAYVVWALPLWWPLAIVIAIPLAAFLLHVPMLLLGAMLPRWRWHEPIHAKVLMTLLALLSLWFASGEAWPRAVAWCFLGALALNGLAALIAFALRRVIARAERPYREGAQPFAI